jgi:hypothetical protein
MLLNVKNINMIIDFKNKLDKQGDINHQRIYDEDFIKFKCKIINNSNYDLDIKNEAFKIFNEYAKIPALISNSLINNIHKNQIYINSDKDEIHFNRVFFKDKSDNGLQFCYDFAVKLLNESIIESIKNIKGKKDKQKLLNERDERIKNKLMDL